MTFTDHELKGLEKESGLIVKKVGDWVYQSWRKIRTIHYKDIRDTVTNVDVEAENMLREELKKLFPSAGFIVEEGESDELDMNWIIDPIDGTKNYVHELPMFVTQIALARKEDPLLGHIYNPVSQQLFSGSRNNGISLNQEKLTLQFVSDPKKAILDIDFGGYDEEFIWKIDVLSILMKDFYRVRMSGGFMSFYIISGAIDGYIELSKSTKKVDLLPRIIIMKEAGLKTEYLYLSKERKLLLSSSAQLYDHISSTILNAFNKYK